MVEGADQKESTMDPLKKPVPSGLNRPVKQPGLTHACWLESARQLDQPRTWWDRVRQKTNMQRANTQSPLRCSPPASSEAQPDHRRKVVQKVGNQRHSQWHPVSRQRENRESHPQCMQYPPKGSLGERSSTWRKEKWGRRESSAFKKQPRRSSKEERRGGLKKEPNSLQPPGGIVNRKGEEVSCVKEQHQVGGREGGLKSKDYQDRQSQGSPY